MLLLAGDIGGTKTHLGIFRHGAAMPETVAEEVFQSDPSSTLEAIVEKFLGRYGGRVSFACFGVAGPVVEGASRITNLPWRLDETVLARNLHIPEVKLINDLEAIAWAVPYLQPEDVETIRPGRRLESGNMAVIAPGTGLGEAYLTWDGHRYQAYGCEGGHTDFAPQSPIEIELLKAFQGRFGHVSYERVCSGLAIPHVYRFLDERTELSDPAWFLEKLSNAADPTRVIVDAAMDENSGCSVCSLALDVFVSILGAEAGNLALKIMATGGIYIAGGIGVRIAQGLKKRLFQDAFLHKGRMSTLVARMPIHVITNPRVGLIGAACYSIHHERQDREQGT